MSQEEYGTVKIHKDLLKKIEKRIQGTEFKSVDEYTTFVLEEIIKEDSGEGTEDVLSEGDENKVKERLRALGYLD